MEIFGTRYWHVKEHHNTKVKVITRKNAPLVDKSFSSSLNGSDLEQMSYNRVGRLPLEVVEIWNESL